MTRQFEEKLSMAWPASIWQRVPVVVAVSGGADSVALLRGLISLAEGSSSTLVVAHFNHRLRPDSDQDAKFVEDLCGQLQLLCELGVAIEELSEDAGGSIEDAARDARYEFLTSVARQVGARYVATAHTADDQAETILHRIVRGTGVRGLGGIPVSRELVPGITLVRPLLDFRRSEVEEYLAELGQQFLDDSTNVDERFTRNRIRHSVLPGLRANLNSDVDEALCRLGAQAEEASRYLEDAASVWFERAVDLGGDSAAINLEQLSGAPPLIVRTVLRQIWHRKGWPEREMTFARWDQLERFINTLHQPAAATTTTLPGNIRVEIHRSFGGDAKCLLRRG